MVSLCNLARLRLRLHCEFRVCREDHSWNYIVSLVDRNHAEPRKIFPEQHRQLKVSIDSLV